MPYRIAATKTKTTRTGGFSFCRVWVIPTGAKRPFGNAPASSARISAFAEKYPYSARSAVSNQISLYRIAATIEKSPKLGLFSYLLHTPKVQF
jgi:hypothetical protein